MDSFAKWLENFDEEQEIPEIRGEYWIEDGYVEFADGDVGDYNHEALAARNVVYKFTDQIAELAEELGVEAEKDHWGHERYFDEENPDVEKVLNGIREKLEEKDEHDPDGYIQQKIGADNDAYAILQGGGDARQYVIDHDGWIAVRGHNVELLDYQQQKRNLARGLGDIFEQEGFHEEFDPEKIEFSIHEHKTGKRIDATLAEIENVQTVPKIQPNFVPIHNPGDHRFLHVGSDTAENTPAPKKPDSSSQQLHQPHPASIPPRLASYDAEAKKKGLLAPGKQFWRGTSESFSFRNWLLTKTESVV